MLSLFRAKYNQFEFFVFINESNQLISPILIRVCPCEGGRIYTILTAICSTPTLHLTRFMASSPKPTLLLCFSTCIFHVFFGSPRFIFPFTSNSNAFHKTCPSSLLRTCPYHLTRFTFAIWTTVSLITTSPLGPLSSFSPSVLRYSLLSPLLSRSFSKLPFHFPSNTMPHSHITSPILHNSDKPFL